MKPTKELKAKGKMTMRALAILTAVCFSTSTYAQGAPPKAGNKPLLQVKPKEPTGCKLVGRVKGTKLWAGDCVAPELTHGRGESITRQIY